ncbi:SRPBCC family protein [Nocardia sp. CA-119907]|uniref:SRPBCC family protein n=1 Tax=Nocardia sp. CA-119907 TaxID=3239973 RepID=UPI003D978104
MSSEQAARMRVAATPDQVRAVLLDPLSLPEWNSAFLRIDGRPEAVTGEPYRLTVRPGLSGTFDYVRIEPGRIDTRWSVPGFTELGSWHIQPHGAATEVEHAFGHEGPLAAVLAPAYRSVARIRLTRLAARLGHTEPSSSHSAGPQ